MEKEFILGLNACIGVELNARWFFSGVGGSLSPR